MQVNLIRRRDRINQQIIFVKLIPGLQLTNRRPYSELAIFFIGDNSEVRGKAWKLRKEY